MEFGASTAPRERGEVLAHSRGIGVVGTERLLVDRQRALEGRPRRGEIALGSKQRGEVVEARRGIGIIGAERFLADRQGALEERPRCCEIACDSEGNLAAATSTGGMTGKAPGRVGDSPLIGAGTYADNTTCAVSATGHGEFFIRYGVAFEIAARLRHGGQSLQLAARAVVEGLGRVGGRGGVVAVDRGGRLALPFNADGMYPGYVRADGAVRTAIWDEPYLLG